MAGPVTLPEWLSGCGENFRQRALNPMSMSFEVHIIAHHIVIIYIYIHTHVLSLFLNSIYHHCLLHASIFLLYIIQYALTFDYSKSLEHTSGICDHTL